MEDKIDKSAAGNVMVTGKPGWGKTCLHSQIVTQLRQRYASEDNVPLADTLRKNCNVWIILKSGDERHGE